MTYPSPHTTLQQFSSSRYYSHGLERNRPRLEPPKRQKRGYRHFLLVLSFFCLIAGTVYHKYGLLNGTPHNASILVKGNEAFSLVIYTNSAAGYSDDNSRTAVVHQLTNTIVSTIFDSSFSL